MPEEHATSLMAETHAISLSMRTTATTFGLVHPHCFVFPTRYIEYLAWHGGWCGYDWSPTRVVRTIHAVPLSTVAVWATCDVCNQPFLQDAYTTYRAHEQQKRREMDQARARFQRGPQETNQAAAASSPHTGTRASQETANSLWSQEDAHAL